MSFLVLSGALTLLFLGNHCNGPQHLPFPSPPALDKGSVLYSLNFINRSWLVFKTPCAFCLQCLFSSAPMPPTYPASPGLVKHSSFPFPLLIFLLLFPCGTVHCLQFRALVILGKHSITELHRSPRPCFYLAI